MYKIKVILSLKNSMRFKIYYRQYFDVLCNVNGGW